MSDNSRKVDDRECVNVIQALKDIEYIKEGIKELKSEHSKLSDELKKKGEEIRETFYIAEETRRAFEEHSEQYLENLRELEERLKGSIKNFDTLDTEVRNIKNNKFTFLIKTIVATILAGLVLAKQFGFLGV